MRTILYLSLYYLYNPIYLPESHQVFATVVGDSINIILIWRDTRLDFFLFYIFFCLFFIIYFSFILFLFLFLSLFILFSFCFILFLLLVVLVFYFAVYAKEPIELHYFSYHFITCMTRYTCRSRISDGSPTPLPVATWWTWGWLIWVYVLLNSLEDICSYSLKRVVNLFFTTFNFS